MRNIQGSVKTTQVGLSPITDGSALDSTIHCVSDSIDGALTNHYIKLQHDINNTTNACSIGFSVLASIKQSVNKIFTVHSKTDA